MPAAAKPTSNVYSQPYAYWTGRLRMIAGTQSDVDFEDEIWTFDGSRSVHQFDWRVSGFLRAESSFLRSRVNGDVTDFAKKLWVEMASQICPPTLRHNSVLSQTANHCFEAIIATLWFCETERRLTIDEHSITDFLHFLLTYGFNRRNIERPFQKKSEPRSYNVVSRLMVSRKWALAIDPSERWPQIGFRRPFGYPLIEAAHRRAFESMAPDTLTWGDYKKGGNLDKLGLDIGQYYVGHCFALIERNKTVCEAISCVFDRVPDWSKRLSASSKVVDANVSNLLSGINSPQQGLSIEKWTTLRSEISSILRDHNVAESLCSWDAEDFYGALSLEFAQRTSLPKRALALTVSAAVVCFVALAGWRTSELGFSFSSIKDAQNRDPLSQKEHPRRHFVRWKVFKTTGDLTIEREITNAQYDLLRLIFFLRGEDKSRPCLTSSRFKWMLTALPSQLSAPWMDFVINGNSPRATQQQLEKELEYWVVAKNRTGIRMAIARGRYKSRPSSERATIEKLIDADLKVALSNNDTSVANRVSSQISAGVKKLGLASPSPHSFRHMWAEAMLRRFDGDIGWLIRSQFQHISQSQWRAYTKDKANGAMVQLVTNEVVSELLGKVLSSKRETYAGPSVRAIRRIVGSTMLLTNKKRTSIRDFVDTQVHSFTATPWGYCLLRRSSAWRSKCTEDSAPQPQNASDTNCLSCTNFLTSKSHSAELLFIANTHAEIISSPNIPVPFRKESAKTLRAAAKYLEELSVPLPDETQTAIAQFTQDGERDYAD